MNNIKELYHTGSVDKICDMWDEYCGGAKANQFSEWEYMYYLNSLYKLKRYADCLEVYKTAHNFYPTSRVYSDKMGWSVYHLYLKNHDFENQNNDVFFRQAEYVMKHCDASSNYSPIPLVLGCVIKALKATGNTDYEKMNRFLDYVTPEQLSDEEKSFKTNEGTNRRMASERESWYMNKAKALLKLKKYEDCILCCNKAFEAIKHFHNNGDYWLIDKKIDSLIALGRIQAAEKEIRRLLRRGDIRHWGIYDKAFNIYCSQANDDKALEYLALCALKDYDHEKRVKVYEKVAYYLHERGLEEAAMLHRQLTDLLRIEKKWKSVIWDETWLSLKTMDTSDKKAVLAKLEKFWHLWRDNGKEYYDGKIEKIFPNKKTGFISNEQGKTFFFFFRYIEKGKKYAKEGSSVRFALEERENSKKKRIELNAINISVK